jgi:DNA topoisomerase-1
MKLVVIEGPGKRDTLKKYLGEGYDVMATKGHVRDLPAKSLGVDVNKNFEPKYEIMPGKENIIKELKAKASKAETVLLATDPDREGEAISWHIQHILGIDPNETCRVEFNEISKSVVNTAIKNPRKINIDLVHAQQGRRVLDRLVGYKVSPIICNKIKPNLSAGRVQSVTLKLIVDREKEIVNFKPQEYWPVTALLEKDGTKFKANLANKSAKKIVLVNEQETNEAIKYLKIQPYIVKEVKRTVTKSNPPPPFTTSTMQQDALNKIGMNISITTRCAQSLYEGVELGSEGKTALITYIRTDSTRVSPEAQAKAKEFIIKNYGEEYAPKTYNFFKTKKNVQDAHEAIRPISLERTPESVRQFMSQDNYRLYKLVYERFVASQMTQATFDSLSVTISAGVYDFKSTGRTPIFAGFTRAYKIYEEVEDETSMDDKMPPLEQGDKLDLQDLKTEQKFTKPPARFTEATLIKMMEDKGIGRPATYAPTVMILQNRSYTQKEGRFLKPTDLGETVTEFLEKYFPDIMNVSFTAEMEDNLDEIENGKVKWQDVVAKFYSNFEQEVRVAYNGAKKVSVPLEVSDVICEKCGARMVVRQGKYAKFLACPNYPKCKNIKPLTAPKQAVCSCPLCGKDVIERHTHKGKVFYGCSGYPACNFASWEKPTNLRCPKCKSYLTVKELKNVWIYKCSNKDCDFEKRENPPVKKQENENIGNNENNENKENIV